VMGRLSRTDLIVTLVGMQSPSRSERARRDQCRYPAAAPDDSYHAVAVADGKVTSCRQVFRQNRGRWLPLSARSILAAGHIGPCGASQPTTARTGNPTAEDCQPHD
jgi:hypothetical protein